MLAMGTTLSLEVVMHLHQRAWCTTAVMHNALHHACTCLLDFTMYEIIPHGVQLALWAPGITSHVCTSAQDIKCCCVMKPMDSPVGSMCSAGLPKCGKGAWESDAGDSAAVHHHALHGLRRVSPCWLAHSLCHWVGIPSKRCLAMSNTLWQCICLYAATTHVQAGQRPDPASLLAPLRASRLH